MKNLLANFPLAKRDRGFSLVELVIVVAIIGILATIAVPNYLRFQRKVLINAGKANLSTLYAAEKMYFAEHSAYTTRLDALGFSVQGKTYYDIGFKRDIAPPVDAPQGTVACNSLCNPACSLYREVTCMPSAMFDLDGTNQNMYTAGINGFVASAHAHFNAVEDGDTDASSILINQDRLIQMIEPAY